MTKNIPKMVKIQISEIWQEGVDDEGGKEGEPGEDKKYTENGDELDN
jgi:hypothetical protein